METKNCIFPCTGNYLSVLDKKCQKALLECPGERLQLNKNRGKYFYKVFSDISGKRTYISKSDPRFRALAQKYCAARILNTLEQTNWRSKCLRPKTFNELDRISVWLEDRFGDYCPLFVRSRRKILREWQQESYRRNPFELNEEDSLKTLRKEYVRSKTERIIADYLFLHNIPYRLEYPVKVGDHTVYPDFMIVSPYTGRVFFLEAMGRMQDYNYVKRNLIKINEYSRAGLILGDNLYITFESDQVSFNSDTFERLIEHALKC